MWSFEKPKNKGLFQTAPFKVRWPIVFLILIREFYQKGLTKEEIETVGDTSIEKEEILNYVEAKLKRTKASYSTEKAFDENEAEILRQKAISFVNKVKEIIDSSENLLF